VIIAAVEVGAAPFGLVKVEAAPMAEAVLGEAVLVGV
jgi:hypothetical protein